MNSCHQTLISLCAKQILDEPELHQTGSYLATELHIAVNNQ